MSSIAAVASSSDRDDFFRPRTVATSFHEDSVYGSPKQSFDIVKDGWVSSFDEDGNFLEVSFEASPDNESVLLMGGTGSEAVLNQHFFPRMSINTSALSSIAPRISALKNPMSNLKNPIARFNKKKSNEENETNDEDNESVPVSSGKKRRRNKKLAKRVSKMASKVVPKRFSTPKSEQEDAAEATVSPSRGNESAKKLKKKIMKRISKKVPSLRMRKLGQVTSAEGAFPTVHRDYPEDHRPRVFASNEENNIVDDSSLRDDEVPATSTDETSETSSCEEFAPNMVEATVLYHDQRLPTNWGEKGASPTKKEKMNLAHDLDVSIDESRDNANRMRIQRQLEIFNDAATFSCDLEELIKLVPQNTDIRRRSHSACVRTDSTEFADLNICCSNSTGGMACTLGPRDDDSMSETSAQEEELITPTSATTSISVDTPSTKPKTIVVPKDENVYESPSKSPNKSNFLDTDKPPQSPVRLSPVSASKNGSANKKQFNYRAKRRQIAMTPTRLEMMDVQAPSSPIGDLRKPRRRHSLKRTIKRGIRANPVATTTVALSAVLFFLRSFA